MLSTVATHTARNSRGTEFGGVGNVVAPRSGPSSFGGLVRAGSTFTVPGLTGVGVCAGGVCAAGRGGGAGMGSGSGVRRTHDMSATESAIEHMDVRRTDRQRADALRETFDDIIQITLVRQVSASAPGLRSEPDSRVQSAARCR
jgi:hypothetical protein